MPIECGQANCAQTTTNPDGWFQAHIALEPPSILVSEYRSVIGLDYRIPLCSPECAAIAFEAWAEVVTREAA